jgi:hypothetical protein
VLRVPCPCLVRCVVLVLDTYMSAEQHVARTDHGRRTQPAPYMSVFCRMARSWVSPCRSCRAYMFACVPNCTGESWAGTFKFCAFAGTYGVGSGERTRRPVPSMARNVHVCLQLKFETVAYVLVVLIIHGSGSRSTTYMSVCIIMVHPDYG